MFVLRATTNLALDSLQVIVSCARTVDPLRVWSPPQQIFPCQLDQSLAWSAGKTRLVILVSKRA